MNACARTVHASVDTAHLLSTAERYFNATVSTIVAELLQNARRAGAKEVRFQVRADALVIEDDGCGIDDPAKLLRLAGSGWDAEVARSEDPAGAGFFSLAHRKHVEIHSRGFTLTLDPAAFRGVRPVEVSPAVSRRGTRIAMSLTSGEAAMAMDAVRNQARHAPVPVTLNGTLVEQCSFLDGAVHVKTWRGLRIGVFSRRAARFARTGSGLVAVSAINFHGLTVPVRLPSVTDLAADSGEWVTAIDVDDAPGLALVLPARQEVVENAFMDDLRTACRVAIYEAVADRPTHRLSYASWREARVLGVELPEAEAVLRPWQPSVADRDAWRPQRAGKALTGVPKPILVDVLDVCASTALGIAAGPAMDRLFDASPEFAGYGWYPTRLITEDQVAVVAVADGRSVSLPYPLANGGPAIVDRIEVTATVVNTTDEGMSESFTGTIPAYAAEEESVECCAWWVAHDAAAAAAHEILMSMTFSPSDDAEADSYDTQRAEYEETLWWHLRRALKGDAAAFLGAIRGVLERVYLRTPDGGPARIILTFDAEGRFDTVEAEGGGAG